MDFKIAICDDSADDRAYLAALVKKWAARSGYTVQLSDFVSGESFLFHYEVDSSWDILLLDIEMGQLDGVTLAKRVRAENQRVQIVFITGFPDFMAEGYEVSALHYLMKPVEPEKLLAVLDRAAGNLGKAEKHLRVSFDRQTALVPLSQITYIEAQKQYVAIHTKAREYRMKASLSDTEKELDEYFFRCQRSFLVNLRYVQRIDRDQVLLTDGTPVPISRGMAPKIGRELIRLF